MANRFWVGGTGTWDNSATTHWSTTTGGSSGASAPGTNDIAILDASSGGGTVTVNADLVLAQLTMGAFTGTLDFSANNNAVTAPIVSVSGTGTRTLNMGSGTWTITSAANRPCFDVTTTTGLTMSAASSAIVFTPSGTLSGSRGFATGGGTYGTVTINNSATQKSRFFQINGGGTIATLTINPFNFMNFGSGSTLTITNAFNWAGTQSLPLILASDVPGSTATISVASGSPTISWAAIFDLTFTGGATFTATDSLNVINNSGITISNLGTGSGAVGVIGG